MHEPERPRSLLGPVLLILVGVGLLLSQFGLWRIPWENLIRFWPTLLVLLGLDLLLSRTRLGRPLLVIVAVAAVVGLALWQPAAWGAEDRLATKRFEQGLDGASSAQARLHVGVGTVTLRALEDGNALYRAVVRYDPRLGEPRADLSTTGGAARLELRSEQRSWSGVNTQNADRWEVELSSALPWALRVEGGVSRSTLDLRGLPLSDLDVQVGVGEMTLTLSEVGTYKGSIQGGVGTLTVELPQGVPVRARVDGGLGSTEVAARFTKQGNLYLSPEYQAGQPAIEVTINGGIGSLRLR
jgi:hypothetical protein